MNRFLSLSDSGRFVLLASVVLCLCSGCATRFAKTSSYGDLSIPVSLRAVIGGHARSVVVDDAEVRIAADGRPRMRAHLLFGRAGYVFPGVWEFRWIDPTGRECSGAEGMQGGRIDSSEGFFAKSISPVRDPIGVVIDIDTGYVSVNRFTGKTMPSVTSMFSHSSRPGVAQNDPFDPWLVTQPESGK